MQNPLIYLHKQMISECNTVRPTSPGVSTTLMPGVVINIARESMADYLQMRAAQLAALNHLITSGDFENWSATIKADAKWLAASLASEVSSAASNVTFRENLG